MVAVTLIGAALGAAAGALGLVTATFAGSSILAGALLYGGLATASYFVQKAFAPKPPDPLDISHTGPQARNTVFDSTTAARWVLGRARTGGFLTWIHEEGENVFHMVITLSEGPCEALHACYVDGENINIVPGGTSYSGATAFLPGSSSDYRDKLELWFYSGGTRSGPPASLAAVDSSYWDSSHLGVGLCMVHVKLTQPNYGQGTRDVDYDARFWSQIPQINFVIDGLKITWPGQTTPVWTRNAAALRYWYETERLDRPSAGFDNSSVRAAVTTCGTRVGSGAGADIRYAIDGVITSDDNPRSILSDMDFAMQGFVSEVDGRLKFNPGRERANSEGTVLNVNSELITFQGARPAPALSERINAISMTLDQSSNHDWLSTDIEEVTDEASITRDGRKLTRNLATKRFITNPYTARRLMAIAIRRARASATYAYQLQPGNSFQNLNILPGTLVLLTDIARGLDNSRMMVIHQTLEKDWSVRLTMVETPTGIYADDSVVRPQKARSFSVARSYARPSAPAGVSISQQLSEAEDGTIRTRAVVSWNAVPFTTLVFVKKGAFEQEVQASGNSTTIDLPGQGTYAFTLQHRNARSIDGSITTGTLTVNWDDLTPPTPTLVSITAQGGNVQMVLGAVTRRDITSMAVRYNYSSNTSDNLAVITDTNWSSATDFGLLPVNRGASGRMYTTFQAPLTGRFRFSARYISRHSSESAAGDLGQHNLVAGQNFTWRGAWDNATTYIIGDLVSHDDSAWIAKAGNVNSEPASSSTDWDEFAAGGIAGQDGAPGRHGTDGVDGVGFRWRNVWDASTSYVVNDIVQDRGSAWICTVANTNSQPSGASQVWDLYAQKGEDGDDGSGFRWRGVWSNTVTYQVNDLVRHDGSAWVATTAGTNQTPATNSTFWNPFAVKGDAGARGADGADGARGAAGDGFQWRGEWDSTVTYVVRDIVHHNRGAWVAIAGNLNSTPASTSTDWDEFAQGGERGATGSAGSDGAGYQFIFRRTTTDTAPTTPTSTAAQRRSDTYVPTSWSDDPTGVDATNRFEWVSVRIGSSGAWGQFSSPSLWSRFATDGSTGARGAKGDKGDQGDTGATGARGATGDSGADGSGFEMVFRRNNSATAPAAIATTAAQRTTNDFVPSGWSDDPTGVTSTQQYEWVSIRTGTTGAWSEFSTPSLWAKFSEDGAAGADGAGYRWRGAWSNSTAYVINDIVRHDGKAWVCINAHTGDEPS